MPYQAYEKVGLDEIADYAKPPRHRSNNKCTKFLATSLAILFLYLSVGTVLHVQSVRTISNQVCIHRGNLTGLSAYLYTTD
jgi:hypothetical protein